jgi:hypothetical protein
MTALSFSNMNLDLARPECSVAGFGWLEKYAFLVGVLPGAVAATVATAVFVLDPCVRAGAARCRRTGRRLAPVPYMRRVELATTVLLAAAKMMYLMLANETLAFFDCTQVCGRWV